MDILPVLALTQSAICTASSMNATTCTKSFSFNPRDVNAGVPAITAICKFQRTSNQAWLNLLQA